MSHNIDVWLLCSNARSDSRDQNFGSSEVGVRPFASLSCHQREHTRRTLSSTSTFSLTVPLWLVQRIDVRTARDVGSRDQCLITTPKLSSGLRRAHRPRRSLSLSLGTVVHRSHRSQILSVLFDRTVFLFVCSIRLSPIIGGFLWCLKLVQMGMDIPDVDWFYNCVSRAGNPWHY